MLKRKLISVTLIVVMLFTIIFTQVYADGSNSSFQIPIYNENFDRVKSNWTEYGGTWSIKNGTYNVNSGPGYKSVLSNNYSDFTYEADLSTNNSNAGLIFRVKNPSVGADSYSGYYAGIDAANNGVVLGKSNNNWTGLGWYSTPITPCTKYHIKIIATGPNISVYLDDMQTPKISVIDSSYTSGNIGLRTWYGEARFDNIVVKDNQINQINNYSENFSIMDRWTEYGGDWSVQNGKYSVNYGFGDKSLLNYTECSNMSVEADVQLEQIGNAGLIFRIRNSSIGIDSYSGYYVGIDSRNNGLVLGKADNNYTGLGWYNTTITIGTVYHLKVEAIDSLIKIYLDDMVTPKISINDSSFISGSVGFRTCGTKATFDNISIMGNPVPTNGGYNTYTATINGKTYHYSRNTVTPYYDLCQMFKVTPGYTKVVQELYDILITNNIYDQEEFEDLIENDSISVLQSVDDLRGPGKWVNFWAAGLKYAYEHKSEFPVEDFKVATTFARDLIRASLYGRTALAQSPDESAGSYLYDFYNAMRVVTSDEAYENGNSLDEIDKLCTTAYYVTWYWDNILENISALGSAVSGLVIEASVSEVLLSAFSSKSPVTGGFVKTMANAISKIKSVSSDFLNNIRYLFESGDEVVAYIDDIGNVRVPKSQVENIAKMEQMAEGSGKLLNTNIRMHPSTYLGSPTQSELYELMRTHNIPKLSEASAYWYVDKQASTTALTAGENSIKVDLGIDPKQSGIHMVDLLKTENSGKLVPIEVKNQTVVDLVDGSNCSANKFTDIVKFGNANEITQFEIICNEESVLPPNFMTDGTGKIYELVSGTEPAQWAEWKFGGKNVYIRKADLGQISVD